VVYGIHKEKNCTPQFQGNQQDIPPVDLFILLLPDQTNPNKSIPPTSSKIVLARL
jgi:hypothetical protein